jgi:MFS family permease
LSPPNSTAFAWSPQRAYFSLLILTLVQICAHIDRTVIGIVLEPMKHEFRLSDGQLGAISGLAFAAAHVLACIPFGRLADRTNRRNLLVGAVGFWSLATSYCGLAQGYIQLLIGRAAVGLGEAAGQSASLSMVVDLFPRERRNTATSLYYMAAPISGIIALAGGGVIVALFGWRSAFFIAAAPGLALMCLLFLVRHPVRGGAEGIAVTQQTTTSSFADVVGFIFKERALFHLMMAIMVLTFIAAGIMTWAPAFFVRTHDFPIAHVGFVLGIGGGGLGLLSLLLGGPLIDRLSKRDHRWVIWSIVGTSLFQLPVLVAAFLIDNPIALYIFVAYSLTAYIWISTALGATQDLTPPTMRASVAATIFSVNGLVGVGLGPQFVGLLSDFFEPWAGADALGWALIALAFCSLWAIAHLLLAANALQKRRLKLEADGGSFVAERAPTPS